MNLQEQVIPLFILALPVACIAWTVTHEKVFKEPRNYCLKKSKVGTSILQRNFFIFLHANIVLVIM
jgi:hypothetical protein